MVCTGDFRVIPDFEYRLPYYSQYRKLRPRFIKSLSGDYSSVNCCFSYNIGHWWIDCLPRILLLSKVETQKKIKLIAPSSLGATHRESLEMVLPGNFTVEYHADNQWLRLENFILPSMISGRCNYLLPREYYDFIREPVFRKLNLPARHELRERIYISRAKAKWRRLLNESEVCELLLKYGFVICELERLSFAAQVELFHKAQIVVAPHGAGINTIMFSGEIDLVVLYPTQTPQNYFHTLALGMGQRHHFLAYPGDEDSDFTVDVPALERLLNEKLGLQPDNKLVN
jgi:capsular polysaccharide biosynthesis protein